MRKIFSKVMSKRAVTKIQAIVIILVVAVAAVGSYWYYLSTLPSPVEYKKTLVIAIPEESEGLDIQQVSWANEPLELIFQSYMAFNSTMGIVPDLAVDAKIEGNSVIIYLPGDAKFSNGDPITAQVMQDAIERYRVLSPYGSDYDAVIGYQIINNSTLKIITNVPPMYIWLNDVPTIYGVVVNVKVAKQVGDAAFNENPIGCGPYKVKEWVHGSHITLVRNDLYKTNLPFVQNKGPNTYIDEITIRFISEDLTRISELEAGRVDIVRGVPSDAVSRLRTNPNVVLYENIVPGVQAIRLNCFKAPLNDSRVRQALMYAVNRAEINTTLEGTVLPTYLYMSPTMLAYNASLEQYASNKYAYSVEKAKSLLQEAGWVDIDGDGVAEKDGKELTLDMLVPNDAPKLKKIGPLLQAKFAAIGVKVNIKEFSYSYIRTRERAWDFDMACMFYSWHDPAGILPYLLHTSIANRTYSNLEVDKLFDKDWSTALDPVERTKLYTQIQLILLNDSPWIPLFTDKDYTAVSKNVKGLLVMPPYGTMYIQDTKVVKGG